MTRMLSLATAVAFCLGAFLFSAAPAEAQTTQWWPKPGVQYDCSISSGGGGSFFDLTYSTISGNNYYRWGYTVNSPAGPGHPAQERVVFVRKANYYPSATIYEYTTNHGRQCTMEVRNGFFILSGCNDGSFQFCTGQTWIQTGP